jgi:hypothetical protein
MPSPQPPRPQSAGSSPDLQQMLQEGLRLHQAGRIPEAAQIYGRILDLDNQHADSLHLLGMASHYRSFEPCL